MTEPVPAEDLAPLNVLAKDLGVPYESMRRWADVDRRNNFPEPVERIGNVRFFVRKDVERWLTLWRMTKKGSGNG